MIQDILIPFVTIGLAELGDKTQLAVLLLASKTKKHLQLLLGVILAFIIADGLAVLLGDFMTNLLPIDYIKAGAGAIFILFGIIILASHKEEKEECHIKTPFISGFLLILASEMGDKTQIASALFAAEFNPFLVLLGVIAALAILSAIAVYLGISVMAKMNKRAISIAAGALFIAIGVWSFF